MGSGVQLYKRLGRPVLRYAYRVERSPVHIHFQNVQVQQITCIRGEIHGEFRINFSQNTSQHQMRFFRLKASRRAEYINMYVLY